MLFCFWWNQTLLNIAWLPSPNSVFKLWENNWEDEKNSMLYENYIGNEYVKLGIFTSIDQEGANKNKTSFVRYSRTNFILCRNIHFMIYGFDEVCTDWLLSPTHLFWFAESYIAGDVVDSCWLLSQVWVASFYLCVEYIFHHHCIHHF